MRSGATRIMSVTEENGLLQLRTAVPGDYSATLSSGRKMNFEAHVAVPQLLTAGWTLEFQPNWGAPAHVDVPQLKSWTEFNDPGVRYFSGTATYLHLDCRHGK